MQALFAKARVAQESASEDDIAFTLGPRINIASRMGSGLDAFELLTTGDNLTARTIADELDAKNKLRRKTVDVILNTIDGGV